MEPSPVIRLTEFAHGAGCGCKIAPQVLEQMLRSQLPESAFPQLLVGNHTNDDAAVMAISDTEALVSTTDFFMPIVDDATTFGHIAAANAISDVYAMGGRPIMAIAILGWPVEKLPPELASQVLDGARQVCAEAGIPMAGGHSIDSPEPFFGLSVTGLVQRRQLKTNSGAKPGDLLLLTKALGTGIISTAHKRQQLADAAHYEAAVASMCQLNHLGQSLGAIDGVHALTDVTGFGLLGHTIEMAKAAGLSAALQYTAIPVLPGARQYLQQRIVPDATYRNWNAYSTQVQFAKPTEPGQPAVNVMEAFSLLPDPQTNGGLLIAVSPDALPEVQALMAAHGLAERSAPIGHFTEAGEKEVTVYP